MEFFDIRKIINLYPAAVRFDIVGRRKAGKSFSVKCEILDNFIENNKGFLYVSHEEKVLKNGTLDTFFNDVLRPEKAKENYKKQLCNKYNVENVDIVYYKRKFWICEITKSGSKVYLDTLGITTFVKDAINFKRNTLENNYDRVLFDEIITDRGYYRNFLSLYQNIIDTIDREDSKTIRIYNLGNPDYNIEQCPMFTEYKFDYAKIPFNQALTFDSKIGDRILKNTRVFVKVGAHEDVKEGLITRTSGIISAVETRTALSGEVKHYDYNEVIISEFERNINFTPLVTIEQETAVYITNGIYKKIYATLGFDEFRIPTLIIHRHDRYKLCNHIKSSYFKDRVEPKNTIYKANLQLYPKLNKYFNKAILAANVFCEDSPTAQTFFNIRKEGQQNPYC